MDDDKEITFEADDDPLAEAPKRIDPPTVELVRRRPATERFRLSR
jgi:hypothetical protein